MLFASILLFFTFYHVILLKIINIQSYKDDAMHIKLLKHRSQPDPTVIEMDKNKYYIIHLERFSDL